MRLGVVAPINFVDAPFGGTLTFIKRFLESGAIPGDWSIFLIGVADVDARFRHRNWDGIASGYVAVARLSGGILPLRARFYQGLLKRSTQIEDLGCDAFYAHTPDAGHAVHRAFPRVPLILHRHGLAGMIRRSRHWYGRMWPVYLGFDRFITAVAEKNAARILVTSDRASYESWIRRSRHVVEAKTALIPAMVDTTLFAPPCAPRRHGTKVGLVAVGRLEAVKGLDLTIEGLAVLRGKSVDAELTIVGTGSHEKRLRSMARERGVEDSIRFEGYMPAESLAEVLRGSDVYLSGSYQEGFSIAMLEALASGVPCVVTNTSGVRDVVSDGENGWILKSRDPEELAMAVMRVREAGAPMRERARVRALPYSAHLVSEEIITHVADVVGSNSLGSDSGRPAASEGHL